MPEIARSGRIVILTGAGISKESGLDTFRCAGGLWSQVRLEDVATPTAFRRNPTLVQDFYNARRRGLQDPAIEPNAAHLALAKLEEEWPGEVLVVTQNIDNLHERAGSRNLVHMHGELLKIRCTHCAIPMVRTDDLSTHDLCPDCGRTGTLRPHVVWFGEIPLAMDRIAEALAECVLFVAIGTSGTVYPAAGFVEAAAHAHTVLLNLDPAEGANLFDECRYGPATDLVPAYVNALIRTA